MTALSLPVARFALPALVRRHWRLGALLALGIGPFLPSLLAMRDFLLAENALGFTPFALPAAAWLFWARSRGVRPLPSRDVLVDTFLAAPLVALALFVLFVTPGSLSWYFWLNRVDLAALAPWATAVALAFLGYQQVLRTWPAWAMLVLAWPYPAVWLQRVLTPLFVDATVEVARWSVAFLRLPYAPSADPQVFTSTHLPDPENYTLVVGQLCSGTSTTIGFLIAGTALAFLSQGSAMSRVRWLGAGLLVAFLSNLLRVVVLLVVAATVSRDFAVDQLHPVIGAAFFLATSALMLVLLRPFGLRLVPVPRGERVVWEPSSGGGRALRVLWALAAVLALAIAAGVAQAQAFNFIGAGEGAPAISVESERGILPQLAGWDLVHETEISWTDLFGGTSRGDAFSYYAAGQGPGGPEVGVQTVVTDDLKTLHRYSIEQCIAFHDRELEARAAVDLGHGVTGYVLHDTYEGIPSSVLYWVLPVNVDGEVAHARIALYGDVEAPTSLPGGVNEAPADTSATMRFAQSLENAMDGLEDAGDGARAGTDRGLVALAITIVDTMLATGGPAATLDAEAVTGTAAAQP